MICMIHHCNPFVLVHHFIEKWTYKFSLMIKGENVGVNGDHQSKLVSRYFWPTINGGLIGAPQNSPGESPQCMVLKYIRGWNPRAETRPGDCPKPLLLRNPIHWALQALGRGFLKPQLARERRRTRTEKRKVVGAQDQRYWTLIRAPVCGSLLG